MIFNSIEFALFLPLVFALYWFAAKDNIRRQNLLLLVASYIFYGWWDWRFLSLILFSTLVDYSIGLALHRQQNPLNRKVLLWSSILVNLGFLGFFKYYNFFADNFAAAFTLFGRELQPGTLNIILPVGISFYTFQTMSYSLDIYRGKLEPERNFIAFAAFVSFFPQLVAGPIERATNLLPQFAVQRRFSYAQAADGMRQILWGLFKKVVIADNCAELANAIFDHPDQYPGSMLLLGALFFTFQIYGDFSGYSDIAIGTSRLFGFTLQRNFAFPYFSRDIAEFWRRWHISLSTWFRDYLYIPLGGSRGGTLMKVRNTFIIFLVSGFWHGANWTFLAWGLLNAIYFLPLLLSSSNRNNLDVVASGRTWPSLREFGSMATTFGLTVLAWVFFRAESLNHALAYLGGIFSPSLFTFVSPGQPMLYQMVISLGFLILFLLVEWRGRHGEYALEAVHLDLPRPVYRWSLYMLLWSFIFVFSGNQQEFIYFQF